MSKHVLRLVSDEEKNELGKELIPVIFQAEYRALFIENIVMRISSALSLALVIIGWQYGWNEPISLLTIFAGIVCFSSLAQVMRRSLDKESVLYLQQEFDYRNLLHG